MQESVEQRRGERGVVVEDFWPAFERPIGAPFCSIKFRRNRFWICGRLIFFGQLEAEQ
jgi:hypothetical protein